MSMLFLVVPFLASISVQAAEFQKSLLVGSVPVSCGMRLLRELKRADTSLPKESFALRVGFQEEPQQRVRSTSLQSAVGDRPLSHISRQISENLQQQNSTSEDDTSIGELLAGFEFAKVSAKDKKSKRKSKNTVLCPGGYKRPEDKVDKESSDEQDATNDSALGGENRISVTTPSKSAAYTYDDQDMFDMEME